jgi:hypothetical protein
METYLTIAQCEDGYLYLGEGRNFDLGVYRADRKAFVGLRCKWGTWRVDEELHWDAHEFFGTIKPFKKLEICPLDTGEATQMFNWLRRKAEEYKDLLPD